MRAPIVALPFATAILALAADRTPEFSDYPANIYKGAVAKPHVPARLRKEKGYRAVLDDADKLANFARRYFLSEDTCGTNCAVAFIADRRTGAVFDVGGFASHFPPDFARGPDLQWSFEFHPNSSLLIAHGCRFEDERVCGAFYFEMTGRGAKLIRSIAFKPAPAKRP